MVFSALLKRWARRFALRSSERAANSTSRTRSAKRLMAKKNGTESVPNMT